MRLKKLGVAGAAVLGAGLGAAGTFGSGEQVGFDPKTVTVGEGAWQAVVTVARDACENPAFRLSWRAPKTSTNESTATPGADYTTSSNTVDWAACAGSGRDVRVFTVPIFDDDDEEGDETIEMSLSASRTSTQSTTPLPSVDPDGTIVIEDDDAVRLSAPSVTVGERDGRARVTVVRSGDAGGEPITVDYATANGSAKAGDDFEARLGDVEIPAGAARATVDIPIRDDDDREGDESFGVVFSWGEQQARATVTIEDARRSSGSSDDAPQQAPAAPVLVPGLPATTPAAKSKAPRRCLSKRRFTVKLGRVRGAKVTVGGKTVRPKRRGGALTATVDLRGRKRGVYTVKIKGRDAEGRAITIVRRYRTCTPRGRA